MSELTDPPAPPVPSTAELKRVLGFWDLMGAATGQIIGAGIMTLTGAAIAMTGRSVPISFLLAAVLVVVSSIPFLLINGTARLRGGQYTIITQLVHPSLGGFFAIVFTLTNLSIAMYAISFAEYLQSLVPGLNVTVLALVVLTAFWLLNMVGVNAMAKVENLIVVVLVVALGTFIVFGVGQIAPDYFDETSFMTAGPLGLLQAAALLTFATGGGIAVANLSGEAKNPVQDVPRVILASTIGVAVLYAFMSVIAAGVLPVEHVAGKPLTDVARTIMPEPVFYFFIVGGAMFALVSTLNAQFAWATKPLLQASVDGWFPRWLGYLHPKTKTPMVLLGLFYLIGVVPIVFGLNVAEIGSIVILVLQITYILTAVAVLNLDKKMPKLWSKSAYRIGRPWLWAVVVAASAVCLLQAWLMAVDMKPLFLVLNVLAAGAGLVYSLLWYRTGRVTMEVSYEES